MIRTSWWVDFRVEGVRYRRRSPANTRSGALAYERHLRDRLARGEDIASDADADRPATFREAAEEWFSMYVRTNLKPSVQQEYRAILDVHLLPRFGPRKLSSISTLEIERFKAFHVQRGVRPATINNYLILLSGLFSRARKFKWVREVPEIGWMKVPPQPFDFLGVDEARTLLEANSASPWHDMILCGLRTGMRVGELLALRWDAVNLDARIITVHSSIVRGVECSPKSNRIRHIPINDDLHNVLSQRERKGPYVFGREGERPKTLPAATKGLVTACKHAGLRRIGWHVLRHTFASHLCAAGAPIVAVQSLLGHSTIQMTLRYSHLAPSTLVNVVQLLDSRPTIGSQPARAPSS